MSNNIAKEIELPHKMCSPKKPHSQTTLSHKLELLRIELIARGIVTQPKTNSRLAQTKFNWREIQVQQSQNKSSLPIKKIEHPHN